MKEIWLRTTQVGEEPNSEADYCSSFKTRELNWWDSHPGRDLPPGGLGEVVDLQFLLVPFECFGRRGLRLLLLFKLLRTVTKLSVDLLSHLFGDRLRLENNLHILASKLIKFCIYIYFLFVTMPYSIVNLCAFDKRSIKSVLTYLLLKNHMQLNLQRAAIPRFNMNV